jgi:hypothetical protein
MEDYEIVELVNNKCGQVFFACFVFVSAVIGMHSLLHTDHFDMFGLGQQETEIADTELVAAFNAFRIELINMREQVDILNKPNPQPKEQP